MSGFDNKIGFKHSDFGDGKRSPKEQLLYDACKEIDRLRDTLTATENAITEAERAITWALENGSWDQATEKMQEARRILAAARSVVSADPPEQT